jgi:hypothetical protein
MMEGMLKETDGEEEGLKIGSEGPRTLWYIHVCQRRRLKKRRRMPSQKLCRVSYRIACSETKAALQDGCIRLSGSTRQQRDGIEDGSCVGPTQAPAATANRNRDF